MSLSFAHSVLTHCIHLSFQGAHDEFFGKLFEFGDTNDGRMFLAKSMLDWLASAWQNKEMLGMNRYVNKLIQHMSTTCLPEFYEEQIMEADIMLAYLSDYLFAVLAVPVGEEDIINQQDEEMAAIETCVQSDFISVEALGRTENNMPAPLFHADTRRLSVDVAF